MKHTEQKKKTYHLTARTYRHFSRLRIVGFVEIVFFLIILLGTIAFTYITVYKTLGTVSVEDISTKGVGVEVIDFRRLDDVSSAWNQKHATSTIPTISDPFFPGSPLPETPSVTTTLPTNTIQTPPELTQTRSSL